MAWEMFLLNVSFIYFVGWEELNPQQFGLSILVSSHVHVLQKTEFCHFLQN